MGSSQDDMIPTRHVSGFPGNGDCVGLADIDCNHHDFAGEGRRPDFAPLARTIESEIIPRLMMLHRQDRGGQSGGQAGLPPARFPNSSALLAEIPADSGSLDETVLSTFMDIVVNANLNRATTFIDSMLGAGLSIESLILDILTPTARTLGELWLEDRLSFVEVTIGLSRLQQLIRVYGPALEPDPDPLVVPRSILLSSVPGDTHTLGIYVVESFLRRDGWDVRRETKFSRAQILSCVKNEWFDVVGLTVSCDASLSELQGLITDIRNVALNRNVRVMAGGSAFLANPAIALSLGADVEACSAPEITSVANQLIDQQLGIEGTKA